MEVYSVRFILRSVLSTTVLITTLWSYGISTSHCQFSGFNDQVRHLLMNEMMTQGDMSKLSTVFNDLQRTLQTRWPGSKVFPLGSFVTGLAMKSSDADCMVTIPNHNVTSDRLLVLEAAHLLEQHPKLFDHIRPKIHAGRRIPLLKFTYIPTKRNCDVNFIANTALQNSNMMGYYFSLDRKFLTLAAILKIWAKVTRLRSTEALASNTLNLMIIFYLQQVKLVPPFALLQKDLIRCPVNNWETSFNRVLYRSNLTETVSLYQLLGGFFKYYSTFNFDKYIVSPYLGRPILRREMKDVISLPNELSLYKHYIKKPNSKPLKLNTKLCVQDAIEHSRNTADISLNKALKLLSQIKYASSMFDVLSSNKFLRVILAEQRGSKMLRDEPAVREVRKLKGCFNITVHNPD